MSQEASSSTRGLFSELKRLLQRGWYGTNFDDMSCLAREAAWISSQPAALFFLSELLWILHYQWDIEAHGDQAFVPSAAVELMERDIRPPLEAYFDAGEAGDTSRADEWRYLDALVLAMFRWRSRGELRVYLDRRPPWQPRGI